MPLLPLMLQGPTVRPNGPEVFRKFIDSFKKSNPKRLGTIGQLEEIAARTPEPFLFGSRAYGKPKANSDWDLALLVSPVEQELIQYYLTSVSENEKLSIVGGKFYYGGNEWNLVMFTSAHPFYVCHKVTQALIKESEVTPVSRKEATQAYDKALQTYGFSPGSNEGISS